MPATTPLDIKESTVFFLPTVAPSSSVVPTVNPSLVSELPAVDPSFLAQAGGETDETGQLPDLSLQPGNVGVPGWKRISSRQWIRNFRDCVSNTFAFPYRTICKSVFVTSGYYDDMVDEETYLKYKSKTPVGAKRTSRYSQGSMTSGTSKGKVLTSTTDSVASARTSPPEGASLPEWKVNSMEKTLAKLMRKARSSMSSVRSGRNWKGHKTRKNDPTEAEEDPSQTTPSDLAALFQSKKHKGRKSRKVEPAPETTGEESPPEAEEPNELHDDNGEQ